MKTGDVQRRKAWKASGVGAPGVQGGHQVLASHAKARYVTESSFSRGDPNGPMMNDDDDSNLLVSSKFDLKAGVPRYSGARLPTRMDARANGKTTDRRAPTGKDGRITWENFVLGPGLLPRLGSTALLKLHIVFSYSPACMYISLFQIYAGYINEFEYIDDHRAGKIVVELNGRINKCGVISPRYDLSHHDIEEWVGRLLPSRLFGTIVMTTSSGIMDHEEARRRKVGGKVLGFFY